MKPYEIKHWKEQLKNAKANLRSAKKAGSSNATYIKYWERAVKSLEKKLKE